MAVYSNFNNSWADEFPWYWVILSAGIFLPNNAGSRVPVLLGLTVPRYPGRPDLIALVSEEYTDMLIATRGVEPSAPVVRVVLVELPAARMDPGFEPLVEKPTYNVLMLTATRMPALEILPGIPESVPIEAPNTLIEPLPDPE
jgi:hypothetical protein